MADELAMVGLARCLQEAGFLPIPAFTTPQLIRCVETGVAVVIFDVAFWCQDLAEKLTARPSDLAPATVAVAESAYPEMAAAVDVFVPPSAPPARVVSTALALARRPVFSPGSDLSWGPLRLNPRRREATWAGRRLHLTSLEFRIMESLVLAQGNLVTRSELARSTWGANSYDDAERMLAHVRRIRRKIEADPARPRFLLTVRGEGYRLATDFPAEATDARSLPCAGSLPTPESGIRRATVGESSV